MGEGDFEKLFSLFLLWENGARKDLEATVSKKS
jgi:hypothetical protein